MSRAHHTAVGERRNPGGNLWYEVCTKPPVTPKQELSTVFLELSFCILHKGLINVSGLPGPEERSLTVASLWLLALTVGVKFYED